jgi:creatinine amidohydrolase/Fe(II)-dependent formamide hydrolase-like protein
MERAVDEPDRTVGLVWQYTVPQATRSGVVGTPSRSTPERGAALFAAVVDALAELLTKARDEEVPLRDGM